MESLRSSTFLCFHETTRYSLLYLTINVMKLVLSFWNWLSFISKAYYVLLYYILSLRVSWLDPILSCSNLMVLHHRRIWKKYSFAPTHHCLDSKDLERSHPTRLYPTQVLRACCFLSVSVRTTYLNGGGRLLRVKRYKQLVRGVFKGAH